MRYKVVKWFVDSREQWVYGIRKETPVGTWVSVVRQVFENENDAIKYIKEHLIKGELT